MNRKLALLAMISSMMSLLSGTLAWAGTCGYKVDAQCVAPVGGAGCYFASDCAGGYKDGYCDSESTSSGCAVATTGVLTCPKDVCDFGFCDSFMSGNARWTGVHYGYPVHLEMCDGA